MACRRLCILGLLVLLAANGLPRLATADNTLAQRRQRLEAMSDSQRHVLLQKKRRFDELTKPEKKHLRKLYLQLEASDNSDQLKSVLDRYAEWLKSLMPGQRAQLLNLPMDERIDRIKKILREQETQQFQTMVDGRLAGKDMKVIRQWLDDFILANESEILAALPKDRFADFLATYNSDEHRRMLPFLMLRYQSKDLPRPTPEDEARLQAMVSREAREFLDSVKDDEERSDILRTWVRAASFSRMRPPVRREELDKFATTRLDAQQRERLENLPRDRMYQQLRRLYYQDRFRQMAGGSGNRPFRGPSPRPKNERGPRFHPDPGPHDKRAPSGGRFQRPDGT